MPRLTAPLLVAAALAAAVAVPSSASLHSSGFGAILFASNRAANVTPRLYSIASSGVGRKSLTRPQLAPTDLSVSDSGRFAAFVDSTPGRRGRPAYVVGTNGGGLHRLTPLGREAGQAVWSHDDRRLALSVGSARANSLVIVRRDGTHLREVARHATGASWSPDDGKLAYSTPNRVTVATARGRGLWSIPGWLPQWSPKSDYIAVVRGLGKSGNWASIAILNGHGKVVRRLGGQNPAWSPLGDRIAFARGKRTFTASLPSGPVVAIGRGGAPHWSPTGDRIAFTTEAGHILVVSASGGRAVRVGQGAFVGWSRDGRRIAYLDAQLYVVGADGRRRRQVTHEPAGSELQAGWAGGRMVYTSFNYYNDYELYRMAANGGGVTAVTSNHTSERDPATSPDGKLIAFSRAAETSDGCRPVCDTSIWTMNAAGSAARQITHPPSDEDTYFDGQPSWSPDGRELVFRRATPNGSELMIVAADGTHLESVTPESAWENYPSNPTWSRDGRIAFGMSDAGGPDAIFTINANGSGLIKLVAPSGSGDVRGSFSPTWSPDGSRLAFVGVTGIFIVSATGEARGTIAVPALFSGGENGITLSWSPDGTRIAYDLNGHVYSIGLDGAGRKLLAEGVSPNWS